MARIKKEGDFTIDVDGMGRFTFGRRTQRDKYKIRGLYAEMTNANWLPDGSPGDMEAWFHANVEVLAVEFPDNFSLEKLDPLTDKESDERLMQIYLALREKELSFRPKPAPDSTGSSQGTA